MGVAPSTGRAAGGRGESDPRRPPRRLPVEPGRHPCRWL